MSSKGPEVHLVQIQIHAINKFQILDLWIECAGKTFFITTPTFRIPWKGQIRNDLFLRCQIFLGTTYQNGGKIFQTTRKYAKRPQNIPHGRKIYPMTQNIPHGRKIYQMTKIYQTDGKFTKYTDIFRCSTLQYTYVQFGIFGFKIHHLSSLQ
jgi:hypothetical protein